MSLSDVNLEQLTQRHPERVRWEPKWSDYRLLYRGGDDFLRSCGQLVNTRVSTTLQTQVTNALTPQGFSGMRNRRFLWQLEGEPDAVYYSLWNRAYYLDYMSAIIDYFRHWLFSEEPVIRPSDGDDPDWWPDFCEDTNGSGKSFTDFVRDVFLDVLICRRAGWLIGQDKNVGAKDKDGRAVLTPYPAEQIYDWERDTNGELEWVVLGTKLSYREFPDNRMFVETYTYIDRDQWQTWEIKRGSDENAELTKIGESTHGLGKVPFVMLEIPEGLWIADKLAAPCLDLFNKHVRLTNAQLLGCIMQPFIKSSDPNAQGRIFGEGYLIHLKPADAVGGGEEDFGWKSPDTAPLQFIAEQIDKERDEIYRNVHQMALSVDSKAIGAIARSGASKIEDRKASEIILAAYGGYISKAMVRTVNLLGEIYGDKTEWVLDGYKNFNVSSLDEEIQIAALVQTMGFKSKTAKQELELKTLGRLLEFVDEKTKDTITQETKDGYDQEEAQQQAPQIDPATGAAMGMQPPTAQDAQQKPFKAIKAPKTLGDAAENTKAAYGNK